jgi:hypothetical protein
MLLKTKPIDKSIARLRKFLKKSQGPSTKLGPVIAPNQNREYLSRIWLIKIHECGTTLCPCSIVSAHYIAADGGLLTDMTFRFSSRYFASLPVYSGRTGDAKETQPQHSESSHGFASNPLFTPAKLE